MDAAAAVNVLASLTNPPTIQIPSSSTRLTFLGHGAAAATRGPCSSSSSTTRNNSLILALCSTKPDVGSNNATNNNNPTFGPDSNPIASQFSSATPSNHPSSSSSSTTRGLVFDLGSGNSSWDSQEIGSPVVKRFISDEEERWYMWYHGNSNGTSDSIGLAVSSNGVHWERGKGVIRSGGDVGMVMFCSKDWWAFDVESIRPSDIVIMSSAKVRASSAVYWLYYTGYSSEKLEELSGSSKVSTIGGNPERGLDDDDNACVFRSLPGLAISQDGRHWARIEGEHHSGALFDVGCVGKDWDSLFIASPHVVFHSSGDLRMYYHSFDLETGQLSIGIARSRDGIRWVKLGKIIGGGSIGCFDEIGVLNAHVVRKHVDGGYIMVYEGIAANGRRSIGLAASSDGLKNWKRCGNGAILKPCNEEYSWDNYGVGSPCLVQMDGQAHDEWRLYYKGIGKGGRTGIGMAVSEGGEIENFRRWTGFHL